MNKNYNIRVVASKVIAQVIDNGFSMSSILPSFKVILNEQDRALLQELCYGIMRFLPQLEWLLNQLIAQPLTGKQRSVYYLLIVGLYQLIYTRIPAYAVLSETVEGTLLLKQPQLKKLTNGVLRQFQRRKAVLLSESNKIDIFHLHPEWLYKRIQASWPLDYAKIINANNKRPAMWLRINRQYYSRDKYLEMLYNVNIAAYSHSKWPDAIRLATPCNVSRLPGFDQGLITVQDASSQACALMLEPQNNEIILDLCAAPGVKTTHLLEIAPKARVIAVDINEHRVKKIYDNLHRLRMQAEVIIGDGRIPENWCKNIMFDRILLDAPCSGTGVIRRHPDIKWLRREADIAKLVKLQHQILHAAWRILKPGGTLLYTTCSILPQENRDQIIDFLELHSDACIQETGNTDTPGLQCFPSTQESDGFFYAKMIKNVNKKIK